jgi:hypothetical protein
MRAMQPCERRKHLGCLRVLMRSTSMACRFNIWIGEVFSKRFV